MKTITPLFKRGRELALTLLGLLALAPLARASDLVGQTTDANTGAYLANVSLRLDPTDATTTSDRGGRFRFSNLAAGSYQVIANSVGYDPASVTVVVGATGETTLTLPLASNIQKLSAFVVEGYREGRSKAMQQKRVGEGIMDIISSDLIGNLPERNVAEAVSRLPGVNLALDQGEGRYVSIRGSEPNLNQVMMDGANMAAPGGSRLGRAVPLDTLGAGQISSIEVVKSVTPDLDANAIGGSVNIKSRSAFDTKGRFLVGSVTANKNGNTDDKNVGAQVTYANTFGAKEQWGFAVSASYDKRNYSNQWLQFGWGSTTINGNILYLPNDFEIKPETGNKKRSGVNLNLEFRPDAGTQFYLRPGFTKQETYENRFEVIYTLPTVPASVTMTSPTAGTYLNNTRTQRREFQSLDKQNLLNLVGGMKRVAGAFTIEPTLAYSRAKQDNPFTRVRQFQNATGGTGPIGFDLGNGFVPARLDVDPAIDIPSKYSLNVTRDDWGLVDEKIFTAKTDVRWESKNIFQRPGFLKTGFKYLQRDRNSDLESRRLSPVGTWNLSQTGAQRPSVPTYGNRFPSLFLINSDVVDTFIAANPNLVTHNLAAEASNSTEDDYHINEYIYSAYTMGSVKISKLTLLGGVRWEKTDATIRSVEVRTANGVLLGRFPKSGITSYDKYFPNLQAIYHLTDELQVRAAVTQTIGRPAYEDARPLATFNYTALVQPVNPAFGYTGSVNVGNPQLKPYNARNLDISLEWYARKSGGMFSLAAFQKDIADPIYTYSETQLNVVYSGTGLQQLNYTSKRNAEKATIKGLEFNLYQPFKFLPSPLDGFGIEANHTLISSNVKVPTRPGEDIPFFRQPGRISNVTLFYERSGFSGRVAYTFSGEQIYTLGAGLLNDRYARARGQYDAQAKFRFTKNYSITASVRNLTREPDEMSFGIKNLVQMSRLLDRDYRLSVDFNF